MSKTYTLEELRQMKGKSDWARIKNTTEKDIMEQLIADPDRLYLNDDEIKEFTIPTERKKQDERKKDKYESENAGSNSQKQRQNQLGQIG